MNRALRIPLLAAPLALCVPALAADEEAAETTPPRSGITVGHGTTRVTEPLTEEGCVDYLAVINARGSAGVTPANNAAVALWRTFGPSRVPEDIRERFFGLLGVPVPPERGDYFRNLYDLEAPEEETDAEGEPTIYEALDIALERPWSAEELPALAAALEANAQPLDRIVAAARLPRWFSPTVSPGDRPLGDAQAPHLLALRDVSYQLVARSMRRTHAGDMDGAEADLLACHRLGRLSTQGSFVIDWLIGVAIDHLATKADIALMHHARPSSERIAAYEERLRELPSIVPLVDVLDHGERYLILDGIAWIERDPSSLKDLGLAVRTTRESFLDRIQGTLLRVAFDWNDVLHTVNQWFDFLVFSARKPTFEERLKSRERLLGDLREQFDTIEAGALWVGAAFSEDVRTYAVATTICAFVMPSLTRLIEQEEKAHMAEDLLSVALALARHRAERGSYPPTLNALVGPFLERLPEDPAVHEPPRYAWTREGFVLWSVGPDGQSPTDPADAARGDGDDVLFRVPVE